MTRLSALLLCCAVASGDRVVRSDRSVVTGSATADEAGKGVKIGGESVPFDEILLWEGDDGTMRRSPDLASHHLAVRTLAREEVLSLSVELLPKAIASGASGDARLLLDLGERAGLDPKEAEGWEARIAALPSQPPGTIAVPGPEVLSGMLVERARRSLAADQRTRGLELLRIALQGQPGHEGANALLAELAPSGWEIGTQGDWLSWEIDVMPGGVRLLRRSHPDMERARALWRRDLFGVETGEIVFLTPMKETGPVGMCLRLARLTCSALDRMFATETPARDETLPLVIYFYESPQEYMERSRGAGGMPDPLLRMTAGFYTPGENVSRFFWPKGPIPERQVRHTFVHELTHHWIERRCPRWHPRDQAASEKRVTTPGYWIVEGFATFIEEGRYDIERGTSSHFNPHARSLDVVASFAKEKKLIPWEKVLPLTQVEFQTVLDKSKPPVSCPTKWGIFPGGMVEIRLFYEQAGATCHFLYWGEKGKYRSRLLDYVKSFYTSRDEETRVGKEAAFGLTPAELGAKVEAFAQAVMDGWRPGP